MMNPKPSSPSFAEYNNAQLETLLHKPDLSPVEKEQARKELTRRLRDDLLRTAQNVTDSKRRQKRIGRVWKTSRLMLILVVIVLCVSSALCLYVLAPTDWLARLTEFIQPLLNLLSG
jgi:cytochrome c-type biogenesis protein CcmH/NrfG